MLDQDFLNFVQPGTPLISNTGLFYEPNQTILIMHICLIIVYIVGYLFPLRKHIRVQVDFIGGLNFELPRYGLSPFNSREESNRLISTV